MRVCQADDCGVHTFMIREPLTRCPGCDRPGETVPCPECLGTGLRALPGRDKTLVCTGCDYKIDLDEEAPAFLGWVEKMTEQANLSTWGQPKEVVTPERVGSADEGTVQWHLDAARDQTRNADAHDLEAFDADDDIYLEFFLRSLDEAPVADDVRGTAGGSDG